MRGKTILLLTCSLLLVLGLGGGTGGLWAKEPAPPTRPLAEGVGTAFTYQGRLMKDGSPVDGIACDFKFSLWDSLSNPTGQVGSTQEMLNVAVSDGLFTVQLNGGGEFSADAFTGDARWLKIEVRCPTGIGSYIPLTPRQELTATPYALSLRPGATVQGSTADVAESILTVKNTGIGVGVEVEGGSYGIRSSGYFGVEGSGSIGLLGNGTMGVDGYGTSSGFGVRGTAPTTGTAGIATSTAPPAYGVYGESASSFGGAGVYGLATGEGGITGVRGIAKSTLGTGVYGEGGFFGVHGVAAGTGVVNYGVYGESQSSTGYGVYGKNTGGGVAIYADGSGIIESVAETRLAINPFEIEKTTIIGDNVYLSFTHHWLGYTEITNTFGSGGRDVYVPVHNLITLFGTPLKLKSLEVCYNVASSSSYISQTDVYYANNEGGRTTLLTNTTHRTSTTWNCYTVSSGSPLVIDGPMLVYFNLYFAGTGSANKITIGRMVATLVE